MGAVGLPRVLDLSIFSKLSILRKAAFLLSLPLSLLFGVSLPAPCQTLQFPYPARVVKPQAFVRSGPGLQYYPTDTLQAGQIVEVYRQDPGGWYAIRPPEGSFSWVLARQIDIGPDGIGQAKQDQVPVVVGSRLKNLQDVVQVYLKKGEEVELVEEVSSGPEGSEGVWRKIAPPSGEFRWIFGEDVVPLDGELAKQAAHESGCQGEKDTQNGAAPEEQAKSQPSCPSFSSSSPSQASVRLTIPNSAELSLEEFRRLLLQLELDLSAQVLGDPGSWQLEDLACKAQHLLGQAPDAVSRAEARKLLERIGRFQTVQRQYAHIPLAGRTQGASPPAGQTSPALPPERQAGQNFSAIGPGSSLPAGQADQSSRLAGGPALSLSAPPGTTSQTKPTGQSSQPAVFPSDANRFDAVGRLTRVVSTKPGAPSYALLNQKGEVVCYLTPAPGLNLLPLEGKWIGVNGMTGLMLQPRAKHVAVKQVAVVQAPDSLVR